MVLNRFWRPRWPEFSFELTDISLRWWIMESNTTLHAKIWVTILCNVLFVSFGQLTSLILSDDGFPETVYAVITFGTVPCDTTNWQPQSQRHQLSGRIQFALFKTL